MDRVKVIHTIGVELSQSEKIAALEKALRKQTAEPAPRRRGRTGAVGPEERKQISERMPRYWAARKKSEQAGPQRPGQ